MQRHFTPTVSYLLFHQTWGTASKIKNDCLKFLKKAFQGPCFCLLKKVGCFVISYLQMHKAVPLANEHWWIYSLCALTYTNLCYLSPTAALSVPFFLSTPTKFHNGQHSDAIYICIFKHYNVAALFSLQREQQEKTTGNLKGRCNKN